jgi:hypothetical protein
VKAGEETGNDILRFFTLLMLFTVGGRSRTWKGGSILSVIRGRRLGLLSVSLQKARCCTDTLSNRMRCVTGTSPVVRPQSIFSWPSFLASSSSSLSRIVSHPPSARSLFRRPTLVKGICR